MNAYELFTQPEDLRYCPAFVLLVPSVYLRLPTPLSHCLEFCGFCSLVPSCPFLKVLVELTCFL